jgi:hypothetical protein
MMTDNLAIHRRFVRSACEMACVTPQSLLNYKFSQARIVSLKKLPDGK